MKTYVEATVQMSIGDVLVASRTVLVPTPRGKLSDDELEAFVRQAAVKVLPQIAVSDPITLRKAIEVTARGD